MVREIIIALYLLVFRMLFNLFKLLPQKTKTTFVASFGTNILYTIDEQEKQTDDSIVILKANQCSMDFGSGPRRKTLKFGFPHFLDWVRSIYHLATSKKVFIDNYYGFLSVTKFRSNTQCIQLWHASGAIKQFGLKDNSIENRHSNACKRFKNVYDRFDLVIVGSDKMAAIFSVAFDLPTSRILRTGIPRTDFFFDSAAKKEAEQTLRNAFPVINNKKVILYAPTYREHQSASQLDIEIMHEVLSEEYVLFLSLHPKVKTEMENNYPGFVFDVSNHFHINHILVITDILVTDYSSIPFEFSLLNKPMVFYAYDLEEYAQVKGLWKDYDKLVPGPVVKHTEDLIHVLQTGEFNMATVRDFAEEWNQYSDGKSSERLIKTLYN
ncbi:CDP-glycerol glycerophosphotransferase family protein [Virgibacillus doumboii]|uniref:CDP-glycerol glycerophosphotransferase family protein n=1 Tax=Virgibacillus doumboii TaxID=2697503 RepID=UPI0013DEE625|nr:CDP-glycerol glycerophosphotransferase family protein [Virgibacillus doumboii]